MLRYAQLFSTALFVLAGFSPVVSAAVLTGPITNPANGHQYYLLEQDTWTNSEAEAVTLGGHLATINDAAENQWVYDTFANFGSTDRNLWIGFDDVASEGSFVWSSGEPVTFTKWAPGQPNNTGGNEDYAHFWAPSVVAVLGIDEGSWNDNDNLADTTGGRPFGVVEVIPEPASAVLVVCGIVALCSRRDRPGLTTGCS